MTKNLCKEFLACDINSSEAIKLIAKCLLAERKLQDALIFLKKALIINPDDFEVLKDLGNTCHMKGDTFMAKKYYQQAIEINSSYAPALTNLGGLELSKGNEKEGLSLLIKATRSDPKFAGSPDAVKNLSLLLADDRSRNSFVQYNSAISP